MKISNIKTGNKLKYKTFGELKEGDIFYWVVPTDKSIEDITYNITNIKKLNCQTVFWIFRT